VVEEVLEYVLWDDRRTDAVQSVAVIGWVTWVT
jgi:hypothetical protein